ncbi:MAG: hypothetical protein AB7O59_13400 [Pirellulales bacterium]
MYRCLLLTAVALLFSPVLAVAGNCCAHCGCHDNCCKVCRVVCETKKVTKPVYDCECEDFCIPGKSECCWTCDECGHRKREYTPTCGKVHTRVKLVKRNETKEVKSYKWVVEDLCTNCATRCAATSAKPAVNPVAAAASLVPLPPQMTPAPAAEAAPQPTPAADSTDSDSGWRRKVAGLFGRE